MNWKIDKSFDWCYGHRVWSQELNAEFTQSGDTCLACRHLHGHQGQLKVVLESDTLERGMVTDFKHLGWMKDFIDNVLDHKFIMDINDPLLAHEVPDLMSNTDKALRNFGFEPELIMTKLKEHPEGYWTVKLHNFTHDEDNVRERAIYEKYEGMIFVDFVPTSENLAAWMFGIAKKKMAKMDVQVTAVDFWETPKSHCRVEE